MVKIGSELVGLWVVIESKNKSSFNDHIKRKEIKEGYLKSKKNTTKTILKKRIMIEHIIGRLKKYRILAQMYLETN